MNKYVKETVLLALIALPYIYLAMIWNKLPDKVATHFNIDGVANDWSAKTTLWFNPAGLGIGIYLLMLLIPFIDPKKKVQQMGDKYYALRLMLTFFISLLSVYLLYVGTIGSLKNPNVLFLLIGALFAMLGNYLQTIRPNYFIGIRTPWTLENDRVWKRTHRLGGRLWIAGGILIAILSFYNGNNRALFIAFGTITFLMVIIPVVFSYIEFKKEKITNH